MDAESAEYIASLDGMREEVKNAIRGLDAVRLNWFPIAGITNSAAVLATHIAGSESFWVHQVVGGIDVRRDRDSEFAAQTATADDLIARLDVVGQTTREVLSKVDSAALGATTTPRPGEEPTTIRHAIVHQIEHMGQHVGHLALTLQLGQSG